MHYLIAPSKIYFLWELPRKDIRRMRTSHVQSIPVGIRPSWDGVPVGLNPNWDLSKLGLPNWDGSDVPIGTISTNRTIHCYVFLAGPVEIVLDHNDMHQSFLSHTLLVI